MEPLESPDLFCLSAAAGWLELGNAAEALAELSKLSSTASNHPDVLELKWVIHSVQQDWNAALDVARSLVQTDPDRASGWLHQAYALRRVPTGGIEAAREALRPAFEAFPREPTIPYNLSCYACQLGELEEAREWLRQALERGDKKAIRSMALNDEDLQPLWNEIKTL